MFCKYMDFSSNDIDGDASFWNQNMICMANPSHAEIEYWDLHAKEAES